MEGLDVMMGNHDGGFELRAYQFFCLVHLCLANGEIRQVHMVELQFITLHGIIATTFHIG